MLLQIVSDLHLEHGNPIPALAPEADVAPATKPWLLGDAVDEWLACEHTLYVPGNHEYYGSDIDGARDTLARACAMHCITLLDPGAVTIEGVRFIGATLWTDFRLDGIAAEPGAHLARLEISDFDGAIKHRGTNFTTREAARRHATERQFIEHELAGARRTPSVVITHHAPSGRSIGAQYEGDPTNPAFASDLVALIRRYQPALWIHGHMHERLDYQLGDRRVICNPAGYDAVAAERHGYDPQLCITVEPQEIRTWR